MQTGNWDDEKERKYQEEKRQSIMKTLILTRPVHVDELGRFNLTDIEAAQIWGPYGYGSKRGFVQFVDGHTEEAIVCYGNVSSWATLVDGGAFALKEQRLRDARLRISALNEAAATERLKKEASDDAKHMLRVALAAVARAFDPHARTQEKSTACMDFAYAHEFLGYAMTELETLIYEQ